MSQRWTQINTLRNDFIEKAIRFLFLTNAGGAVAVLSFIGNSDEARRMGGPLFALVCFALGIVFIGIYLAIQYHRFDSLLRGYYSDVRKYYADQMEWLELRKKGTMPDQRCIRWIPCGHTAPSSCSSSAASAVAVLSLFARTCG